MSGPNLTFVLLFFRLLISAEISPVIKKKIKNKSKIFLIVVFDYTKKCDQ